MDSSIIIILRNIAYIYIVNYIVIVNRASFFFFLVFVRNPFFFFCLGIILILLYMCLLVSCCTCSIEKRESCYKLSAINLLLEEIVELSLSLLATCRPVVLIYVLLLKKLQTYLHSLMFTYEKYAWKGNTTTIIYLQRIDFWNERKNISRIILASQHKKREAKDRPKHLKI